MLSTSFTRTDFEVFFIDGLENRMIAIQDHIRPKFQELGTFVAPLLTLMAEEPVTTHIAKHARRTVNPPDETWVAWSTYRRGYKAHPHFQIGINSECLFICVALIYECTTKHLFAHRLKKHLAELWPQIPDNYYFSDDHTKPHFKLKSNLTEEEMRSTLDRLEKVKKAEFLCGYRIPKKNEAALKSDTLSQYITTTLQTVYPFYHLAKEGEL